MRNFKSFSPIIEGHLILIICKVLDIIVIDYIVSKWLNFRIPWNSPAPNVLQSVSCNIKLFQKIRNRF